MDPISQGTIGAVVPQALFGPEKEPSAGEREGPAPRKKMRAAALLGCLAGMSPDLDVFISSPTDPLLFLEYHRQFTHALVFIPVGAAIATLLLHWTVRRTLTIRESYLACLLGYATHGFLDACTSYGTQLFWPFTDYRVAWNNVAVVDPSFTVPLLVLVIVAAVRRRRAYAVAGLIWALAYLGLGVVQNQRAEAAGERLAASRGHEPERLTAKASFANMLVWKVVYEYDGRFYVDGVRTGAAVSICPGSSVARLDLSRDLSWLDLDTQQARDVERFRWFSDDYLALDPAVPNRVIDMRYSLVPNEIDPLWGIDLDPEAPVDRHVRFVTDRAARPAQRDALMGLLTGATCAG